MKRMLLWMMWMVWGCQPASELGSELVGRQVLDIVLSDTSTIAFTTLQVDSVSTYGSGRLLVGYHHDETYGKIHARPYFRVSSHAAGSTPGELASFESASLILQYDGYSYYDTLKPLHLSVYLLGEILEADESGSLYSFSQFGFLETDKLGEVHIVPSPNGGGYVEIELVSSPHFTSIFELVQNNASYTQHDFENLLPGFVLVADSAEAANFIGFSDQSKLQINFWEGQGTYEMDFTVSGGVYFTQIYSDRSGLDPSGEILPEGLSSLQNKGKAMVQSGTALAVRVGFPHLKRITEIVAPELVLDAVLEIGVKRNEHIANTSLPATLNLYTTDRLQRITSANLSGWVSLTEDDQFNETTRYQIDVLEYIQYILKTDALVYDDLTIYPLSGTLIDGVILEDAMTNQNTVLKLYILDLKL